VLKSQVRDTSTMHSSEAAIIDAFIATHRRERWRLSLGSPQRRHKFLDCLNHCRDFDPRYAQSLASNTDVRALLQSHGAGERCYVVSAAAEIDSQELPLSDAIAAAAQHGWGTILSCLPGRLAYYYDERGERRFLLLREVESRPHTKAP
jgi:hypothetical protein